MVNIISNNIAYSNFFSLLSFNNGRWDKIYIPSFHCCPNFRWYSLRSYFRLPTFCSTYFFNKKYDYIHKLILKLCIWLCNKSFFSMFTVNLFERERTAAAVEKKRLVKMMHTLFRCNFTPFVYGERIHYALQFVQLLWTKLNILFIFLW